MAVVFFADVLGFSALSRVANAAGAIDALTDLATMFSTRSNVARYLQAPAWRRRYGLSDSIFLVADDPAAACAAAAEIFFNLAFYNSQTDDAVLLRGAITLGDAREIGPLFPETASANLVGEAAMRAVQLEKCGAKGPRLLVSEEVVGALPAEFTSWMLDRTAEGPAELLWPLTPDPKASEPLMVGDVCQAATRLLLRQSQDAEAARHLVAYVDLLARALERLRQRNTNGAETILAMVDFRAVRPILQSLLTDRRIPESLVLERLDTLMGNESTGMKE
jgi:hypothetical protein